jgi:hypothetical protein
MDIDYEFTSDDLKALLGWHPAPELARRQSLHRWAGSAWLALMAASLVVGLQAPPAAWLAAAAVPLLFWWRYPIEARRRHERHVARQLWDADLQGRLGSCTLHLDAKGLRLRTPRGEQQRTWDRIDQVVTTESLVLLVSDSEGVIAVPRRALPDAASVEALRARARLRVA